MGKNEEKRSIFNKQDITYGFLEWASATYTERALGGYLAEIFMAIDEYERYIDELDE